MSRKKAELDFEEIRMHTYCAGKWERWLGVISLWVRVQHRTITTQRPHPTSKAFVWISAKQLWSFVTASGKLRTLPRWQNLYTETETYKHLSQSSKLLLWTFLLEKVSPGPQWWQTHTHTHTHRLTRPTWRHYQPTLSRLVVSSNLIIPLGIDCSFSQMSRERAILINSINHHDYLPFTWQH